MAGALIVEDDPSKLPDSLKNIKEQIMVFQQLFYTPTGTVANLDLSSSNPASWTDSQRRITINGQIVPKITMQPGEVQRWRMIGATFDKFMQLQLAGHTLNEIAVDSLYLPKVDTWGVTQTVELDSGYRSDVLVKASSTPGTYMLTDNYAGQQSVLAAVVVPPTTPGPPKALPTTAEMQQLAYGWTGGVQNPTLESQWNADPVNHGPIPDRHVQRMVFNFGPLTGTVTETNFAVDGNVYPDGPHRKLVLNRIDRWELVTNTGPNSNPHVFHIHVNPFQVIRPGPTGPELVWRDTVSVPKENGPKNPMVMYTQYKLFTGGFVIHCHLVDHEDNGMMQEVDVSSSP
jgi:FtsP/CotA-like multicopper oxidase with cupredoxin domain